MFKLLTTTPVPTRLTPPSSLNKLAVAIWVRRKIWRSVLAYAVVEAPTRPNHFYSAVPKPGETIFGQKFVTWDSAAKAQPGGGRPALRIGMYSWWRALGDDLFGPATIQNFEKLGIDASQVRQVAGLSSEIARFRRSAGRIGFSSSRALTMR